MPTSLMHSNLLFPISTIPSYSILVNVVHFKWMVPITYQHYYSHGTQEFKINFEDRFQN